MQQMNLTDEKMERVKKLEAFGLANLVDRYTLLEDETIRLIRENYKLRSIDTTDKQVSLILNEQIRMLQKKVFGASSEKYTNPDKPKDPPAEKPTKPTKPRVQKPSERYPNIPVVKKLVTMDPPPSCGICDCVMCATGLTEVSEQLTVIPKKFEIIQTHHTIYGCSCHGSMVTTPAPDRIKMGSAYSDDMIIDVALSKYLDLIPIERQAAMARRAGLMDIPPQSLIECTHYLANLLLAIYKKLEVAILRARVLRADETPHRMLEGDLKKSWYLWGFSTTEVCYFECHDTRSGDVASEILIKSVCEYLLTDVYAGYGKAVRIANEVRLKIGAAIMRNPNCNVHARRNFFNSFDDGKGEPEAEYYLQQYQEIYDIEEKAKGKPPDDVLRLRAEMEPYFKNMREMASENVHRFSEKSQFCKGMKYYLKNYENLTLCLLDAEIPLDNNSQESLFRSPVVGRKTWYGTHSERGAKTAAILFSIVETCKLINVNPREYIPQVVKYMLAGHKGYTPIEFKRRQAAGEIV
jgi:transposase